jgi:hypothetical protein
VPTSGSTQEDTKTPGTEAMWIDTSELSTEVAATESMASMQGTISSSQIQHTPSEVSARGEGRESRDHNTRHTETALTQAAKKPIPSEDEAQQRTPADSPKRKKKLRTEREM